MERSKGYLNMKDLSFLSTDKLNMDVSKTTKKSLYKSHGKKSNIDMFQITYEHDKFLCSYITAAEIQQILLDYKANKISLIRVTDLVENTFKSNLKQLLIAREEARYLGYRMFNKYHQAAESEAERLQQFLGKKYVAIYISVHLSSKPLDEIIYLIEEEHESNIANYFPKSAKNMNLNLAEKAALQNNFTLEWHRLRQVIPAEYLIQYCEMLED